MAQNKSPVVDSLWTW